MRSSPPRKEFLMMSIRHRIRTFQVVYASEPVLGAVSGPDDAVPLLRAIFRDACDADREHFIVLGLNARGKIIGYKILGSGTIAATLVSMRDIFLAAIALAACTILVAHSHPSQDPTPSDSDLVLTDRLIAASEILGIPIVDHLIIASSGAPDARWSSAMPTSSSRLGCLAR